MIDQSELIKYYSINPFNNFRMQDFTISYNEESRVCWDTIEVFLKIWEGIIINFSFIGNTSIITKASASVFWESIIWLNIKDILFFDINYIESIFWEVSPRRKHAAILWLLATRNAIHKYLQDSIVDDFSDVLEI